MTDLDALDPPVRRRILERLGDLEDDPFRHATRLSDPRLGSYRVRVDDWRIVFDIEQNTVVVLRIGHRRQIYSR